MDLSRHKIVSELKSLFFIALLAFFIRTYFYGLYQVPSGSMETTMLVGERFISDKLTIYFKPIKRGEVIAFNEPLFPYTHVRPFKHWRDLSSYVHSYAKNLWENYVWGPSNWTKRVIGIPGDHVQGKIEEGKPVIYVNGTKIDEPYVNKYPLLQRYTGGSQIHQEQANYLGISQASTELISYDPTVAYDQQPFYKILNPATLVHRGGQLVIKTPQTPSDRIGYAGNSEDIFDVKLGKNEYWVMGDNRLGSFDSRGWGVLDGKQIHGRILYCFLSIDSDYQWLPIDLICNPISFWSKIRWSRCLKWVV